MKRNMDPLVELVNVTKMGEEVRPGSEYYGTNTSVEEAARRLALSSLTRFGSICRRNIAIKQLLRDMQANLDGSFGEGASR